MQYRNFGRTGVKVSPLCLGCMNFGGKTAKEQSIKIIDKAIDKGINFIDTANVYSRGKSESIVGEALKQNGKRSRIFLATKFFGRMDDDDPNAAGTSRRHLVNQCEKSLKRLKTDHIDLYQIHRPTNETPIDETLRALDDLIKAGKIRYIGTSTFASWQLMETIMISRLFGLSRVVSEQPPYNPMDRRIEREVIPFAITYDIALIPWSPLAGGFFTGKYKREGKKPKGTRFEERDGEIAQRIFNDTNFDMLETMEKMADEKGCTVSQLTLAWCAARPGITSPIIGPSKMTQLDDNLKSLDVEITDEDFKKIDSVSVPGGMTAEYCKFDYDPQPMSLI